MKQYEMAQNFPIHIFPCIRYFIGDVRDLDRLKLSCRDIEILIHAAALKQIDTAEYNPFECIKTNINGSENIIRTALSLPSLKKVIAISTDKAVEPSNYMGLSKKISENLIFLFKKEQENKNNKINFSIVRFGNVLGLTTQSFQ